MPDPKAKGKGIGEQFAEKAVDQMTEKYLGPVLDYIGNLCKEFLGYLCNVDEHFMELKEDMVGLSETRKNLEHKFRAGWPSIHFQEYTKFEGWCEKEKLIRKYANTLVEQEDKEDGSLCHWKGCARRFYGKKVFKCRDRVRSLKEDGEKLIDEELLEKGAPDDQGESFLDNLPLAVGSGASCSNEAPPQQLPQPQPQPV